jgi:hypothetical protein
MKDEGRERALISVLKSACSTPNSIVKRHRSAAGYVGHITVLESEVRASLRISKAPPMIRACPLNGPPLST